MTARSSSPRELARPQHPAPSRADVLRDPVVLLDLPFAPGRDTWLALARDDAGEREVTARVRWLRALRCATALEALGELLGGGHAPQNGTAGARGERR